MTISGFVAYVKQAWKNKPDTSTPLSAARLTHVEEGVKANSDAIAKIAAAVINQQANDANKIPSSALMYSVNEKVDSAISDLTNLNNYSIKSIRQNQSVCFGTISVTTDAEGIAHISHSNLTGNNFMAICIPDTPRLADGCVVTNASSNGFDITVIKDDVVVKNKSLWIRYISVSNYY